MIRWEIPLLAPRAFSEFSPAEFHDLVKGLKYERKGKGVKLAARPWGWSINKKGTLVLRIRRKPQWLSREEIELIEAESGRSSQEVWLIVGKRKIAVSTAEEQTRMKVALAGLPW